MTRVRAAKVHIHTAKNPRLRAIAPPAIHPAPPPAQGVQSCPAEASP